MKHEDNKPVLGKIAKWPIAWRSLWGQRSLAGKLTLAIIALAYAAVLIVGLAGREPMVVDEVLHYYMLVTQAKKLPAPNVDAEIPMCGWLYKRQYPHVFLWHYVGASVWLACGRTFWSVQFYQSLFWLQLLVATWLLARMEKPRDPVAVLLCVTGLASLPMALLFSVLFYQDLPAVAQIVTSFLFLRRRRMWPSLLFMALALSIKVTVFVFLPVYFLCVLVFFWGTEAVWRTFFRFICAILIIVTSCAPMAIALRSMEWNYYPVTTLEKYMNRFGISLKKSQTSAEKAVHSAVKDRAQEPPPVARPEIANHPGDLRTPANWIIYGGGILWVLVLMGIPGLVMFICSRGAWRRLGELWPLGIGLWYLLVTAYHMRTAPDARFFLPGIAFILISLSRLAVKVPWRRVWLPLILAGSLLQGGAVLAKTFSLRRISPEMQEAIDFVKQIKTEHRNYFMYPGGHDRFFPGGVAWYLEYELRDFWRADNDQRIRMLAQREVGIIIIKKYKIKNVSPDTHDLGVYPQSFVDDIQNDPRFRKIFENSEVVIFLVPATKPTPSAAADPPGRKPLPWRGAPDVRGGVGRFQSRGVDD